MAATFELTGVEIKIDTNAADVAAFLDDASKNIESATRIAATNKTMAQVRTRVQADITAATGVPKNILAKRMKIYKATRLKDVARLFVGVIGVAAIKLGAKQIASGVSFRGPGGSRARVAGGFIQTMPRNGRPGVFKRRGAARLPIDEQRVPIDAAAKRSASQQLEFAKAKFREIYARDFEFRVGQSKAKNRV